MVMMQTISSLEKDIAGLKKEIGERDETIGDKEKRIYDLKKKNQVGCFSHMPGWHACCALHSFSGVSCIASVCFALPCPALPCPALPCPALPCPALLFTAAKKRLHWSVKFGFDCCIDAVSIASPTPNYTKCNCLPLFTFHVWLHHYP